MKEVPWNAMKGIRRRKILEYRESLVGEKRQKAFLRYHPGASCWKQHHLIEAKKWVSKTGRFLHVTGETVSADSNKWPWIVYGKQSGTTENSAFAVQYGLQRRFLSYRKVFRLSYKIKKPFGQDRRGAQMYYVMQSMTRTSQQVRRGVLEKYIEKVGHDFSLTNSNFPH